nr:biopolymer transporter ExbD [Allomuricauda sp.]
MIKSRKKGNNVPGISTASLPDIVFMLLFFFMTVTSIKDYELLVENKLPSATELQKLENKDQIIEMYIGKPTYELASVLGTEPRIQLNTRIIGVSEIGDYVLSELFKKPEEIRNLVTVSLKIDQDVQVGIVSDIKEELRKINLLKVSYTVNEKIVENH